VRLPDLATVDFEFQCGVCHRQIRLKRQNEAYFGELIARNEPTPLSSGPTGESATADPEPAITTNERSKAQD
jgi:hypothetical protein